MKLSATHIFNWIALEFKFGLTSCEDLSLTLICANTYNQGLKSLFIKWTFMKPTNLPYNNEFHEYTWIFSKREIIKSNKDVI